MKSMKSILFITSLLLISCCEEPNVFRNNEIKDPALLESLNLFEVHEDYLWINPGGNSVIQTKPCEISLIDGRVWRIQDNDFQLLTNSSFLFNTYMVEIYDYDDEYYVFTVADKIKKELEKADTSISKNKLSVNKLLTDGLYFKTAANNGLLDKCKWYRTENLNAFLSKSNEIDLILKSKHFKLIKNISKNETIEKDCVILRRDIRRRKNLSKDFGKLNLERFKEWNEIEEKLDYINGKYLVTGNANFANEKDVYYYPNFLGGSIEPFFKRVNPDNLICLDVRTCNIIKTMYYDIFEKYFDSDSTNISLNNIENCIYDLYVYNNELINNLAFLGNFI